jgi:hypothetical protein
LFLDSPASGEAGQLGRFKSREAAKGAKFYKLFAAYCLSEKFQQSCFSESRIFY